MKVHVVIDILYGDEGNPGVRVYTNLEAARAEVARLHDEVDPDENDYLVTLVENVELIGKED